MKTDRELLELAAKAAGIENYAWCEPLRCLGIAQKSMDGGFYNHLDWNPLTDDGDALRLAVKLEMNIFHAAKSAYAMPSEDDGSYEVQVRYMDASDCPYAATRRAIVRAAAAIGESMP